MLRSQAATQRKVENKAFKKVARSGPAATPTASRAEARARARVKARVRVKARTRKGHERIQSWLVSNTEEKPPAAHRSVRVLCSRRCATPF